MLVGVAPLPPSLIPTLWKIGILHHKQAKLPKDMQHSVHYYFMLSLFYADVTNIATKYVPEDVELGWYEWWNKQGLFCAEPKEEKANDQIFSMILPPPNVTGHLHLGHALTATIQDGLIRW